MLFKNSKPKETERRIRANDNEYNSQFKYASNYIKTSKYNVFTFLPVNLFEQFRRLANFYFLCLLILQMIPPISSLTPLTTAVPLIVVLAVTAMKDAIDDLQRHRSDSQVNNRLSKVLRNGMLVDERWHKVQVGDIILISNDNFVAADLLLLSTSEPNGLCYVETAELDGETNLKCRQVLPETAVLVDDIRKLSNFKGEIHCEPPNNNLTKFEGILFWNKKTYSLDNDKMLLRGCVLRNTKWVFGVVIFAGRDTKLMQNSGKTIFKRTSLDKLLNLLILGIVFVLISMCLFCTIACGIWETITGSNFQIYLPWDSQVVPNTENKLAGATIISVLIFFSYAIVLNTLVPISLYVSVEIIRFFHSLLINWDEKMYYDVTDTPAKARTTTLNEELGQIEYIFTDKTGTLTQNIMTFNKCSIDGIMYGDVFDPYTGEVIELGQIEMHNLDPVDFSSNIYYEPTFKFYDQNLYNAVYEKNNTVLEFFRLLALCHTVMCEERDDKIFYQAQSPDEAALTSAARNFGFVFKSRTPTSITIETLGLVETYELLAILDFNNVRKRMSVIIRKDEKILLYCKGADSMIFERLDPNLNKFKNQTNTHLNKFASEGLRTLCLAKKEISEENFEIFQKKLHIASTALENREDKVNACYEEIEKNLILIGATAIEDKLQDGVPSTIANLSAAGIKIWVLTGDKQETAINIGYSCQLLTDEFNEIFTIEGYEYEEVEQELRKCQDKIRQWELKNLRDKNFRSKNSDGLSVISYKNTYSSVNSTSKVAPSKSLLDYKNDGNNNYLNNSLNEKKNFMNDFQQEQTTSGFAIVINGHCLVHALQSSMELLFLEVASSCNAVICCRVTPLQKALVVDLVKRHKKAVTLAIGDGANDVSMIKMAHIGVGISGQEGMQAVLASDFALAQFRFLERLLLVHGRYSYFRMCKFLRYFFYKNFAFTLCHFWYAFFCGFSAQTLYDPAFISFYNVFYTSLPVLALGIFDQDVDDRMSLRYPLLYTPGNINLLFNKKEFLKSVLHGIFTSFVLFFVSYGAFHSAVTPEGTNLDGHQLFGTVVSTNLVLVVTAQIALDTAYWTVFNHVVIWGSVAFYFAMTLFINSSFIGNQYLGCLRMALSSAQFWFTLLLILGILLIPITASRFYSFNLRPTLSDRVRLKQRLLRFKANAKSQLPEMYANNRRKSSVRRSRRSVRSGYAFAHQEGFGTLIMSGKLAQKPKAKYNDFKTIAENISDISSNYQSNFKKHPKIKNLKDIPAINNTVIENSFNSEAVCSSNISQNNNSFKEHVGPKIYNEKNKPKLTLGNSLEGETVISIGSNNTKHALSKFESQKSESEKHSTFSNKSDKCNLSNKTKSGSKSKTSSLDKSDSNEQKINSVDSTSLKPNSFSEYENQKSSKSKLQNINVSNLKHQRTSEDVSENFNSDIDIHLDSKVSNKTNKSLDNEISIKQSSIEKLNSSKVDSIKNLSGNLNQGSLQNIKENSKKNHSKSIENLINHKRNERNRNKLETQLSQPSSSTSKKILPNKKPSSIEI